MKISKRWLGGLCLKIRKAISYVTAAASTAPFVDLLSAEDYTPKGDAKMARGSSVSAKDLKVTVLP